VDVALKTENSERELAVGELLIGMLRELRERQIREFADAGVDWSPKGHVFIRWIVEVGREPRRLDPRQDYDAWVSLLERSGVAHARLHVARHTAGTMMVATGTPIEVVQEILGHASIQTTKVYVEAAEELKRDAVNRVAAALLDGSLLSLLQPGAATTPPQG
jgi:integrase